MEIERKFLVKSLPTDLSAYEHTEIEQSYISTSPVIRIRKSGSSYILTVKGKGNVARHEFELPLSAGQYSSLLHKASTKAVKKTRYIIPIEGGLSAELDIYHGELDGLYTVEVEFDTMEAAEAFIPPQWFGADVSYDRRYKNTYLSRYGIPE